MLVDPADNAVMILLFFLILQNYNNNKLTPKALQLPQSFLDTTNMVWPTMSTYTLNKIRYNTRRPGFLECLDMKAYIKAFKIITQNQVN
jgi:hypothetical protein